MSYYDIDDLLAEEYETNTQIHVTPWIDEKNASSENPFFLQFRNVKNIKIPMWLTYELQKRNFVVAMVPGFLNAKGLSGILNNPLQTNLAQYDPFFFTLAFKILSYFSSINQRYSLILASVLRTLLSKRFRENLAPQADNRGMKNVSMKFIEELTEFERVIFKHLQRDFSAFHQWRTSTSQSAVIIAELPMSKKPRLQ